MDFIPSPKMTVEEIEAEIARLKAAQSSISREEQLAALVAAETARGRATRDQPVPGSREEQQLKEITNG